MVQAPILFTEHAQKVLIAMITVSLLGACAHIVPPCTAKNTPPYSELKGTSWELVRWNQAPNSMGEVRLRTIPNDQNQRIRMQFDGSRMSGYSACNRFTAQITEDGRGFQISQIASTRMSCTTAQEEIERDFIYLLNDYRTIARDGDRLLLIGPNREVLSFAQINRPSK